MDNETPNQAKDDEVSKGKITPSAIDHSVVERPEDVCQYEFAAGNFTMQSNTQENVASNRQMMERNVTSAKRACNKQVNNIESLLADELVGIAEFQKACGRLEARMDDLQDAHT